MTDTTRQADADRELLEMAAKAAGIVGEYECWTSQGFKDGIRQVLNGAMCFKLWNPLTDDGDALRLAVSTRINIYLADPGFVTAGRAGIQGFREPMGNDPGAATRRAVVMAAAEIGRNQHG
jgi:hypothetical protein